MDKQVRQPPGQDVAGEGGEETPAVSFAATQEYSEDHHQAVIKIQAVERGQQARRQLARCDEAVVAEGEENFPSAAEYSDEQHEAAVKIQAVERGRDTRRRMEGVTSIGNDGEAELAATVKYYTEHHEAAVRIQAMERGKQGRRRSLDLLNARVLQNTIGKE